jgi:hypothetical protein
MLETRAEAYWENPRHVTLLLRSNKIKAIEWNYLNPNSGKEETAHLSKSGGRLDLYLDADKNTRHIRAQGANVGPVPIEEILGHSPEPVQTRLAVENISSRCYIYLDPREIRNYRLN